MFKWFKSNRRLHQENEQLRDDLALAKLSFDQDLKILNGDLGGIISKQTFEIDSLRADLAIAKDRMGHPEEVVRRVMDRGIEWFDYKDLPVPEQQKYFFEAQQVLRGFVVTNEIKHLIADWAEWALKKSPNWEGVQDMRMQVSGLELLMQRLDTIEDPSKQEEPAEDPYDGV